MSRVPMDILLQTKDMLGNWSEEGTFQSLPEAIIAGRQRFPQNEWRVLSFIYRNEGHRQEGHRIDVLYEHTPMLEIAEAASNDITRFRETEAWREEYARRSVAEQRRMRRTQRLQEQASHRRVMLNHRRVQNHGDDWVENLVDDYFDEDLGYEKVNWKKEGF